MNEQLDGWFMDKVYRRRTESLEAKALGLLHCPGVGGRRNFSSNPPVLTISGNSATFYPVALAPALGVLLDSSSHFAHHPSVRPPCQHFQNLTTSSSPSSAPFTSPWITLGCPYLVLWLSPLPTYSLFYTPQPVQSF